MKYWVNWGWCISPCYDGEIRQYFMNVKDSFPLSVHVIIATPGRILDLMNKNLVKTDHCAILVLDEVRTRAVLC